MIVVLDTNVIVSALLSPSGSSASIINRWQTNEFEVVVSTQLTSELTKVLDYPRIIEHLNIPPEKITSFIHLYAMVATLVEPQLNLEIINEDPADNKVLECAVAGNATYIITGDKHLLKLNEYQGIVILPPAGFIKLLESE
jgi:uncharacterized protein